MTRRIAFTQSDVSRALKGARAAGVDARIHLHRDGTMIIEPVEIASATSDLERWKARRGA
jgi:hypothetical protein